MGVALEKEEGSRRKYMANYNQPSCKICRRNRVKLFLKGARCFSAKCAIEKRNTPPGPRKIMLRKLSEYGKRLREKQKIRCFYNVTDKLLGRYFKEASSRKGIAGHNLITIFETRLDNVLYRSNFVRSRYEGRQLIRHGHFKVGSQKVDIPSYRVKVGEEISYVPNGKKTIMEFNNKDNSTAPSWISVDEKNKSIKVLDVPQRSQVDVPVEEQLVVEFLRNRL
jgi:small subunit ribosomal protein S4